MFYVPQIRKFYSAPFFCRVGKYLNKATKIFFYPVDVITLNPYYYKYESISVNLFVYHHLHAKLRNRLKNLKFGTIVNNLRKDRLLFMRKRDARENFFISCQRSRGHSQQLNNLDLYNCVHCLITQVFFTILQ